MPGQPSQRDLHVDALLTNVSIAYKNAEYIADTIFPVVPVQKQSDLLARYDQSHWFRDEAKMRAPGTKSQRGGYTVDTDNYFCTRYSYGREVADEERDNADSVFNLERDAVEFVTDKLQMRREVAFATDFFTTGVWSTEVVGGTGFTPWSDYASASPLTDFVGWSDIVEARIGRTPNTWVIGKQVWNALKWHPDLIDTIKYTQKGQVSVDLAASLFEVERILIGKAIYTASPEGTPEANVVYQRIWGKNGLLMYVPERPSLLTPAAGYTFIWQRVPSAAQYIRRFRDEEREVDIIEANSYFDQKATGPIAGHFQTGLVG